MTVSTYAGAVQIPEPWRCESDARRFEGLDVHEMNVAELERERHRLHVARGLASDDLLGSRILGPTGAAPMTVEGWLAARLERVEHVLRSRGVR